MKARTVLAIIAGFAISFSSTTPAALSYSLSHFGLENTSRPSPRTRVSSSLMSSSSASSRRTAISRSSVAQSRKLTKGQCMRQAVEKREMGIQTALNLFYNDMSRLLLKRRKLIEAMWQDDITPAQREAGLKATWREFGQSWRTKGGDMKEQIRISWEQFRLDREACGMTGPDEEKGGLGLDSQF